MAFNFGDAEYLNQLDISHPVGTYLDTRSKAFDPNVYYPGTKWELDTSGTVLASKSSTDGSALNVEPGNTVGEDAHKLTVDEMPSHAHDLIRSCDNTDWSFFAHDQTTHGSVTGTIPGSQTMEQVGGNQSHNNIQPTQTVYRWWRIS